MFISKTGCGPFTRNLSLGIATIKSPLRHGPHNPNLGHSVGMAGGQNSFNISSHNYDRMEEGMVFVLHTQWLEPLSAGCNVGYMYVVTKDGFENLSRHTPLETQRITAEA